MVRRTIPTADTNAVPKIQLKDGRVIDPEPTTAIESYKEVLRNLRDKLTMLSKFYEEQSDWVSMNKSIEAQHNLLESDIDSRWNDMARHRTVYERFFSKKKKGKDLGKTIIDLNNLLTSISGAQTQYLAMLSQNTAKTEMEKLQNDLDALGNIVPPNLEGDLPQEFQDVVMLYGENLEQKRSVSVSTYSEIGRGGFGAVYKGNVTEEYRDLAVKIPLLKRNKTTDDTKARIIERVRREATICNTLSGECQYIMPLFGLIEKEVPYIITPFYENGNLKNYMQEKRTKGETFNALRFMREIAEGLEFMHRKGWIHGDLNASNVLVSDQERMLLGDFGLSKQENTVTSVTLHGAGTWPWESPEVILGASRDTASDTWAFGIVGFEIMTGTHPYAPGSKVGLIASMINKPDFAGLDCWKVEGLEIDDASTARYTAVWDVVGPATKPLKDRTNMPLITRKLKEIVA